MWKQALESKGTLLKPGVLIFVLFQLTICVAGLI
jgi:hypothetical protein